MVDVAVAVVRHLLHQGATRRRGGDAHRVVQGLTLELGPPAVPRNDVLLGQDHDVGQRFVVGRGLGRLLHGDEVVIEEIVLDGGGDRVRDGDAAHFGLVHERVGHALLDDPHDRGHERHGDETEPQHEPALQSGPMSARSSCRGAAHGTRP